MEGTSVPPTIMHQIRVGELALILRVILVTGRSALKTENRAVVFIQPERTFFASNIFCFAASGSLVEKISGTLGHTLDGEGGLGGDGRCDRLVRVEVPDCPQLGIIHHISDPLASPLLVFAVLGPCRTRFWSLLYLFRTFISP